MCECHKRFIATLPHRGELEGKDLSKWVTFPTASPVVNLMGSLIPQAIVTTPLLLITATNP